MMTNPGKPPLRQPLQSVFDRAEARLVDKRARQLVAVFLEIEELRHLMTTQQFEDVMRWMILACGFADEIEAWYALNDWDFLRSAQMAMEEVVMRK
jgi:hypothetical protein